LPQGPLRRCSRHPKQKERDEEFFFLSLVLFITARWVLKSRHL
jgi:hypothetical protein